MEILFYDHDLAVCVKPVGLDSEAQVPAELKKTLGGEIFPEIRHSFKPALFPAPREADAAGKQQRVCALIPGTVFVVAHQRIPSGGKLYPDLVAPPRMQANADETALPGGKTGEFQPRFFDA